MAKTENDVISKAFRALNVSDINGAYDATIYATAQDIYRAWHSELLAELRDAYKLSRKSWTYNSVPDDVWINVAWLLANQLVGMVDVSEEAEARVVRRESKAMGGLVKVLSRQKSRQTRFPDFPVNRTAEGFNG
jgi:hypothetical protein